MNLLEKVGIRFEKARVEAAGLRWYKRLNPARRSRLNRYGRQLVEAHRMRREGDFSSTLALLKDIDSRYPSVLGLVYGTPRKHENRREVHEIEKERVLERDHILSGGFHGGGWT